MVMEKTSPVLVFDGPYSNLQATLAMKAETERLGMPPDHCLCTGDVAALSMTRMEKSSVLLSHN